MKRYSIFAGFDVEETLVYIVKKFGARLQSVKTLAAQQGYTSLKGQSIDLLMELWRQAKKCNDK